MGPYALPREKATRKKCLVASKRVAFHPLWGKISSDWIKKKDLNFGADFWGSFSELTRACVEVCFVTVLFVCLFLCELHTINVAFDESLAALSQQWGLFERNFLRIFYAVRRYL